MIINPIIALLLLICTSFAWAAPSITPEQSLTATHGSTLTFTGSDFGSKSPAAPLMWDDGEGTHSILDRYVSCAPTTADLSGANLAYHTGTYRGMSDPARGTRFLAGAHDPDGTSGAGYEAATGANVGMVIEGTGSTWSVLYLDYYHAVDADYPSAGIGGNHKEINIQLVGETGVYDGQTNYFAYATACGTGGTGQGSSPFQTCRDGLDFRSNNSESGEQTTCLDNTAYCYPRASLAGAWTKLTAEVNLTAATALIRFLNGTRTYGNGAVTDATGISNTSNRGNVLIGGYGCYQDDYTEVTSWTASGGEYYATLATEPRVFRKGTIAYLTKGTVGALATGQWGYSSGLGRVYVKDDPTGITYYASQNECGVKVGGEGPYQHGGHVDAFRYYDNVYADNTWSRVMLCNNSTYTSATVCEPQPPIEWASGEITVTANLGALTGSTAYLFVFDSDNAANATGYSVTLLDGAITAPTLRGGIIGRIQ